MTKSNFFWVISLVLFVKLSLFLIGVLAFSTIPFYSDAYKSNFHYPSNESKNIAAFKTWDAQHYLYLGEKGYANGQESNRFFPLYPFLIFVISNFGASTLLSSYLLSTVFSVVCVILLFSITNRRFGDNSISFRSVLLFLSFPSAFFLSLPYSESLFIMLSLLFFYFIEKNKPLLSFFISILLPLTRPTGIFIEAPILAYSLLRKKTKKISLPTFNKKVKFPLSLSYLGVLFPVVGVIFYFLIMNHFIGDFSAGIKGLSSLSSWNLANVFDPFTLIKNLISPPYQIHSFQHSIIDRLFFIFFVIMLPFVYKKMPKEYFYYTLLIGLVPFFGSFTSYTRYILPAFPIFMIVASALSKGKLSNLYYFVLFFFVMLQTIFFVMHILNYWVA